MRLNHFSLSDLSSRLTRFCGKNGSYFLTTPWSLERELTLWSFCVRNWGTQFLTQKLHNVIEKWDEDIDESWSSITATYAHKKNRRAERNLTILPGCSTIIEHSFVVRETGNV